MEANKIMMTVGSVSVVIIAAVGLILSCVNVRYNNWHCIMNTAIFAFLLIIGAVLFFANRRGIQYDRLVEILYWNTIPGYVVPPCKSKTSIFLKLKKIFVREKPSQVCDLFSMNLLDSSSCNMDDDIDETSFTNCDDMSGVVVNSCFDSADLSIEAAERIIQQNMYLYNSRT
ncbi:MULTISPECIES: hypothetical protein [Ehrlichia]|uniref:Lipoprotein n=1 Tax=Ehrlichia cf. muris str. EmCRT TaxID=1359167 RepID=A0A0F3NE21_9RICK|nr:MULTISPECIES: hypothetical protein [Ehrlichia]KJV65962.1 hypothetical protein EMUCRT_0147 [Ehrlichia cf. muris str. EmCRT]OUC04880.1 hypothetical protein DB91_01285 [Ehrlichia sp. Wisconsin_h]